MKEEVWGPEADRSVGRRRVMDDSEDEADVDSAEEMIMVADSPGKLVVTVVAGDETRDMTLPLIMKKLLLGTVIESLDCNMELLVIREELVSIVDEIDELLGVADAEETVGLKGVNRKLVPEMVVKTTTGVEVLALIMLALADVPLMVSTEDELGPKFENAKVLDEPPNWLWKGADVLELPRLLDVIEEVMLGKLPWL